MKIAIIGSGFFGITLGLFLSKKNTVDVFEKKDTILNGASSANQFRFHLGYHYPRSQKTVNEINKSKNLFSNFFGNDLFGKTNNYYLIAKKSRVKSKKYFDFLKKNKLFYRSLQLKFKSSLIENSLLTNEKILNFFKFKKNVSKKIKKSKLNINFKQEFKKKDLSKYDKVIVATYSNNNFVLKNLGIKNLNEFKFELVEKILIKLPKEYINKSFVVVDGNFVCVDPYLGTKFHLLSDVKLSKLETIIGKFPVFKNKNKKFLNKGIIKNINISRFKMFINRSSKYLSFLKKAEYVGSMFVIRTIKKNKEKTDERTSDVQFHSKKVISVLSGKWNNCVYLAKNFKL